MDDLHMLHQLAFRATLPPLISFYSTRDLPQDCTGSGRSSSVTQHLILEVLQLPPLRARCCLLTSGTGLCLPPEAASSFLRQCPC